MTKVEFKPLIALAAFRYALGRKTYIVSTVTEYLMDNWGYFSYGHQGIIVKEIEEAIKNNEAGDVTDVNYWNFVLAKAKGQLDLTRRKRK